LIRVKDLAARERALTLEILLHLIEVERRRLHLGLGCPSMFEYAIRHLGYSESAAARRIRSARCIRDYPEIRGLLEKNEVTLITVSLVAPVLNTSNAKDLISKIRRKSQREVEAIASGYRPPLSMRDQARPVRVAVPAPSPTPTQRTSMSLGASADSEAAGSAGMTAASSAGGPPEARSLPQAQLQDTSQPAAAHGAPSQVVLEDRFLVKFLASKAFMKKLEKAKALLSNGRGAPTYEFVLEAALDEFLKDHDPEERNKRRAERKESKEHKESKGSKEHKETAPEGEPSRRIPTAIRDAVFERDKGRCTFVGRDGKRCDATHHLQIDHIAPYARGGANALRNLRLLCERHNKLEAERLMGGQKMSRFRRRE
jgi:5-methylcytosine-specific restriction endonuclease McrA